MPRKDGFPTNTEMLLSFNTTAHEAYVTAYENTLERKVPDELQDKRLKDITLQFTKMNYHPHNPTGSEVLEIGSLSEGKARALSENFSYRHYPTEILQRYVSASRLMADTAINNSLIIASALPVEGIDADYTLLYRKDGKVRRLSSYHEKPNKQTIVAGTCFAEQAVDSVKSDIVTSEKERIQAAYGAFRMNEGSDIEAGVITHRFRLNLTNDLPLNGYESRAFLNEYATAMFNESLEYGQRAEQLRQLHTSEMRAYDIDRFDSVSRASLAAYIRARKILDA